MHLQENLYGWFPDDELSLIEAMDKVFNPSRYQDNDSDLNEYGTDTQKLLADHCGLVNWTGL